MEIPVTGVGVKKDEGKECPEIQSDPGAIAGVDSKELHHFLRPCVVRRNELFEYKSRKNLLTP